MCNEEVHWLATNKQQQETAEDSKARLSQFDLENQQYQGQVTLEINRSYYWYPSGYVSSLYHISILRFCLTKHFN